MPEDNENQEHEENENDNEESSSSNPNYGGGGATICVGSDRNNESEDKKNMENLGKLLEDCGNKVVLTCVDPNQEMYMKGKGADYNVFICNGVGAATIWSFVRAIESGSLPFTIFAFAGWLSDANPTLESEESCASVPYDPEHDADQFMTSESIAQMIEDGEGATTVGEFFQKKSQYTAMCWAKTVEEMAQKICSGACGGGSGTTTTQSGGGAQIKDTTFERCIRRICAATDSIFIVESNAAVLFPYTDWMAFTLRQKINTIKSNDIDPDVFSIEYGTDGFYNKVSMAWGGTELPERTFDDFDVNETVPGKIVNFTMNDILKNAKVSEFINDTVNSGIDLIGNVINQETNGEITKTITQGLGGSLMLSEQYDALVAKYGELEKRVESAAPDYETAQYIVNALLIQYVRDYNYQCKCRALSDRKYIGGTFYAVENPFTKESELYYLNGYTIRTQEDEPMYHDLDFKYGPEGAEEILDYQYLTGGATSGTTGAASSSEEQIWADAAKCKWAQDQEDCSTQDPDVAKKHYDDYTARGEEVHFDCYGMSAYLYGRFNKEANIPCRVVGNSEHHVVMLYKNNNWQETREEYKPLDETFHWRQNQDTTVLLDAPNSPGSSSSGNTNSDNTNSGNG